MDTPKKKEIREKMFADKYEKRSKSYLEDIRRSAMIEYREIVQRKATNDFLVSSKVMRQMS